MSRMARWSYPGRPRLVVVTSDIIYIVSRRARNSRLAQVVDALELADAALEGSGFGDLHVDGRTDLVLDAVDEGRARRVGGRPVGVFVPLDAHGEFVHAARLRELENEVGGEVL